MEIIGADQDIKYFKDEIDYEDSEIYLDKNDNEKTANLWVEPEDLGKKAENDEKEKENKVKFFAIKNTYEYPHEEENIKIIKQEDNIQKKKKKIDYDCELTEEEKKRLEEAKLRRKQKEEMEKYMKEIEKEKDEENKIINKQKEEEEKKRKERQEKNAKLIQNKKKKKNKKK